MITNIYKFLFLFLLPIIFFLNFKNLTKSLDHDVKNIKNEYYNSMQLYLKREIILTKKINLLQIEDLPNQYVEKQDIIKFNRDIINDFTLIKINYDKSE